MARSELLKQFDLRGDALEEGVKEFLGDSSLDNVDEILRESIGDFEEDKIIVGTVVSVSDDWVIVDVGYKAEGEVPKSHFEGAEIKVGDQVDVLIEEVDESDGRIMLSKRKADRIKGWEQVVDTHNEGDVVSGRVTRKIKGGLLIDIGVPVFLPASQIAIRRVGDVSEFVGRDLECKIIKIDEPRMNIVVSRRKLLEERRDEMKSNLMGEIELGQVRMGTVKNITDFGAFVDLGGIDGLLHITDMSWGRINHPNEILTVEQEIDVKVLKIDKERERISLGLKQTQPSPWDDIEERFPIGSRISGKVVNVLSYGAFIELEEGIEGLVHVSEMSWTRRISNPKEVVDAGQEVDVVVLEIKKEKQEISLGMKQIEVNPWEVVAQKYPVGHYISGKVRNLTNYGAFIELEDGIDGLLHVSDMSWTRKIIHPSEKIEKGEEIHAVVLEVDQERKRIALGLKQMEEDPWIRFIPETYVVGTVIRGTVTKTTNFGAFVQMDEDLEGLLHISELSEEKVEAPEEVVKIDQKVDVKVIKVDEENRKIGLSLKEVTAEESEQLSALYAEAGEGESPTAVGSVPENLPDEIPDLGDVVEDEEKAEAADDTAEVEESKEPDVEAAPEPTPEEPVAEASAEEDAPAAEAAAEDETPVEEVEPAADAPEDAEASAEAEAPEVAEASSEAEAPEVAEASAEAEAPEAAEASAEVEAPEVAEASAEAETPEAEEASAESEAPEAEEASAESEAPEAAEDGDGATEATPDEEAVENSDEEARES
ncbi:MAG: S1 RNA-binding domain-containing protein [Planctomycetota bacterium]|nr:S1 RNA-binding domain-containing protein [Planctomycetota bacterium]